MGHSGVRRGGADEQSLTPGERPGGGQSQVVLSRPALKKPERDGLVSRTACAEVPPRVEYALMDTGKSLIAPALALAGWAIEHIGEIEAGRAAYGDRTG